MNSYLCEFQLSEYILIKLFNKINTYCSLTRESCLTARAPLYKLWLYNIYVIAIAEAVAVVVLVVIVIVHPKSFNLFS
jgi:hypothetical protein